MPPATPPTVRTLTVHSGDTLWDIAAAQLGDPTRWAEIFAMNRDQIDDPQLILPGQVLTLPR